MPLVPVNNPPTPASEQATGPAAPVDDCDALKVKYAVDTGLYKNKPAIVTKAGHQKHHILQNKMMRLADGSKIISTGAGLCVNLFGGSSVPNSEHKVANQAQTDRNKASAKKPNPSYGSLLDASKKDLVKAFKEGEVDGKKRKFDDDEAEKLADCLVKEADEVVQQNRRDNNQEPVKPGDKLQTATGCFAIGTIIWLRNGHQVAIDDLKEGNVIETDSGSNSIIRIDSCVSNLITIEIGETSISMVPYHRVRLASGRYCSASALLPGHKVDTSNGPRSISNIERKEELNTVLSFGVGKHSNCRIGACGLWVEVPDTGPTITAHVQIT